MKSWIEPVARVGFAARGTLYVVVGVLAVKAAIGYGGKTTDAPGAVEEVGRFYAGDLLLLLLALGLAAHAVWRVMQGVKDLDGVGHGLRGLANRFGYLVSAVIHLGWATTAAGIAFTFHDSSVRAWVGKALAQPMGVFLVGIVGAIIIGVGIEQFYRAWSMSFEKHLRMDRMSPAMQAWVGRIGRFGFSARGVTFLIVGWFFIRAAMNVSAREVKDMGEALRVLGSQWHGDVLLAIVACGTIAYGLMTFIEARHRRIVS
jgi:hypothetical protein